MISTLENFDWSLTKKEIVIFMPNYMRAKYILKTVKTISTTVDKDKWIILVINDRIHEDLDRIEDDNAVYLTFGNDLPKNNKGGGSARNIAIKRCQSKWFFQKDPEIIVLGDFIKNIFQCKTDMYRLGGLVRKTRKLTTIDYLNNNKTIDDCINDSDIHHIDRNRFVFFHFGFAVKTKILQEMHGYDEDYNRMYCEDRDLYSRLIHHGIKPSFDETCSPVHLWHEEPFHFNSSEENKKSYAKMRAIFNNKNPNDFVRNPISWGDGGLF